MDSTIDWCIFVLLLCWFVMDRMHIYFRREKD